MKRSDLAHILRAAAEVAGDRRILVVGSQAILATHPEESLPAEATLSMEADVTFLGDDAEAKSDLVEGALGEGSRFHQMNGYFAQGVGPETAALPAGWQRRLVPFRHGDYGSSRAVCPEIHDLVASKLVAGREKDIAYARALAAATLIDVDTLRERVELLPIAPAARRRITATIERLDPSR